MNAKILTSLLLTAVLILSCNGRVINTDAIRYLEIRNTQSDIVQVSYNQKVNGYQVTVVWKPNLLKSGSAVGPAMLEFKNDSTAFTLTNNHFSLPAALLDFETEENNITGIKTNQIVIDYKKPAIQNKTFEMIDVPFLFVDLDFDGEKEILLKKSGQGQRFGDAFDAYSLNAGALYSGFYQITNKEPYNQINHKTKLNKEKKELTLYSDGGACGATEQTYTLVNGGLAEMKRMRMELVGNPPRCFELTYSLENGMETLLSKRDIQM
ncbi:MAG: hypothetical protein ACI836_000482 [Saprospiraceae bacterium]|jgi:hypothetical protein|uniref:hypothetical protein n=1 Tax=Patiriisocius sp. Uisw_047 TaxID=3230969 RepID=UPI0039E7D1B7